MAFYREHSFNLVRSMSATHIPNDQLKLESVPSPDADWQQIEQFALTYSGYTESGSFERCAEIANARCNSTLSELRTCLYFEQRRWRHFGETPTTDAMTYIRELVEKIRQKLAEGQLE